MRLFLLFVIPICSWAQAMHYQESAANGDTGWCGNAVYVGDWRVLTVGHLYHGPISRVRTVDGIRATIERWSNRVATLTLRSDTAMPASRISWISPRIGQALTHRWWDMRTGRVMTRSVIWAGDSHIKQPFRCGMSGSGIYNSAGELVALAESTDGRCWGLDEIRKALR